nr:unnamed protein product [Callosobruchus analis]
MSRLLYLVISNSKYVSVVCEPEPLVPEDIYHPALILSVQTNRKLPKIEPKSNSSSFNFRRADYISLYSALLNVDWSFLLEFTEVDACVDSFYAKLHKIFSDHIPKTKHHSHVYPKWYTSDIIKSIKAKANMLKKYKKN